MGHLIWPPTYSIHYYIIDIIGINNDTNNNNKVIKLKALVPVLWGLRPQASGHKGPQTLRAAILNNSVV